MNTKNISKVLSLVLRHNPNYIEVTLDKNGWLLVDELIVGLRRKGIEINREILIEIVENNDKNRFAFDDSKDKIRANQGHSIKVDLELKEAKPPEFLYHGTVDRFIKSIKKEGLKKMNRQHVHLSENQEIAATVGSRRGTPIILTVCSGEMHRNNIAFYLSENGVWLTDNVASQYIKFK